MTRYPQARRADDADLFDGARVEDPYRWLEDDESRQGRSWLSAQAELFSSAMASLPLRGFFQQLLQEFTDAGSASSPVTSVPVHRGARRFFLHRRAGQELPVLMVADEQQGSSRVVIDPLAVDASGATTLNWWRPSWTGRLLAYQMSRGGSEQPDLRVLDVDTGRELGTPVTPGRPTPIAWLADDAGFYYVRGSVADAVRQIRLHRIEGDPASDPVVFQTPWRQLSVTVSGDGRRLVISCAAGSQAGNQVHLAELTAADPAAPELRRIYDGTVDGSQALVKAGAADLLYAVTTRDAPGGKICLIDPEDCRSEAWRTVVTTPPGEVLSGCTVLVDPHAGQPCFLTSTTRDGEPRLTLYDLHGGHLGDIALPGSGPATLMNLSVAPCQPTSASFVYTSFTTPPTVYRCDLTDRRLHRDFGGEALAADTADAVAVRRLNYPSDDGTMVPLYVISSTDVTTGPRPTILSAYGGFGASSAPTYNPSILAWVKAGGSYAIAGVRGGGERGSNWHAAGRGPNKPNTFTDFANAARWLQTNGWTTPEQLAIRGASHSGLTVAVALTRDAGLYAAAICSDALTDMIRYPRLGLGAWWRDEFGDPTAAADRAVLLSYSPYHNVTAGTAYPAVLLTTPRVDTRVGAAHTRKFAAALQHATSSSKPVVVRTEDNVGHGARAASRLIELQADILAFCAAHTGLTP